MRTYAPHQERVIEEKQELDKKLEKLGIFIDSSTFRQLIEKEQDSLRRQAEAMKQYSDILAERIARF